MIEDDDGLSEADLKAALDALSAAQRRAVESGRTIVLVENGKLVRKGPQEYTVLRELPPRQVVSSRTSDVESRAASK